jgi:transcriptional regulator with XRE-family HTH domain
LTLTDPSFGKRLKALRKQAKLTQVSLAQKSGLTQQAIAKLEAGETEPGWNSVRRLARALGVEVGEFDRPSKKK